MHAYEHREAAEELLGQANEAELGSARERYALDAANTHALLYLGMQFAAEFDPRSTKQVLVENVKAGSVERLHAPDRPRRKPRSVS